MSRLALIGTMVTIACVDGHHCLLQSLDRSVKYDRGVKVQF